jgi:hypothetical protein
LYCGYLAGLFCFMLWVYVSLTRFDAFLRLEEGKSERLAFAPASGQGPFAVRLALPAELHPFDIPATARRLSANQDFSAQTLPFSLGLSRVEVLHEFPPRDVIESRTAQGGTWDIEQGATVALPSGPSLRVLGLGEWRGLVPDRGGARSAAVELDSPDSEQQVLLEAGRWVFPRSDLALMLHWSEGIEVPPDLPASLEDTAWWTVRDGDSHIRINQLASGAGTECSDGSLWTVERVERDDDGIARVLHLRVEESGKVRIERVPANETATETRARFFHPAAADQAVLLVASRDDQVDAVWHRADSKWEREDLALHAPLQLHGDITLRIAQIMAYGLPVLEGGEPPRQALVESEDGRRWRLREGKPERIDRALVVYRRQRETPEAVLHLTAQWQNKAERLEFSLPPEASRRLGAWRVSRAASIPGDESGWMLTVRAVPFTPERILGILLFVGGAFGLVLARFWPRSKRESDDWAMEPGDKESETGD